MMASGDGLPWLNFDGSYKEEVRGLKCGRCGGCLIAAHSLVTTTIIVLARNEWKLLAIILILMSRVSIYSFMRNTAPALDYCDPRVRAAFSSSSPAQPHSNLLTGTRIKKPRCHWLSHKQLEAAEALLMNDELVHPPPSSCAASFKHWG